jgi:uncharacterized protein (DUF433 family)
MDESKLLERIVINPKVMVGKPVIRGTRLTVQHILGLLASGMIVDEILQEYPGLTREDVLASILFAKESLETTTFAPLSIEGV